MYMTGGTSGEGSGDGFQEKQLQAFGGRGTFFPNSSPKCNPAYGGATGCVLKAPLPPQT